MSESSTIETVIGVQRAGAEVFVSDLFHAAWEGARAIPLIHYWSGDAAPPERHAEARLLWSEEALAVRFLCRQSEPLVISREPQTAAKSLRLWERDVCEIFIAPDAREPERYFEFEAAPTGEWIDLEIRWKPEGRETDWHYHSGMTVAAVIEDERVVIAMRLPWEAFGRRPQAEDLWRVNLFRCVGSGIERGYLAWQPTRTPEPNFHVPRAFGWLRFDA
jgi:alpha-galactosidase